MSTRLFFDHESFNAFTIFLKTYFEHRGHVEEKISIELGYSDYYHLGVSVKEVMRDVHGYELKQVYVPSCLSSNNVKMRFVKRHDA